MAASHTRVRVAPNLYQRGDGRSGKTGARQTAEGWP